MQVSWIGYPNTTGLQSIQYRITDSVADPEETTQQYSEKLVLKAYNHDQLLSVCGRNHGISEPTILADDSDG